MSSMSGLFLTAFRVFWRDKVQNGGAEKRRSVDGRAAQSRKVSGSIPATLVPR